MSNPARFKSAHIDLIDKDCINCRPKTSEIVRATAHSAIDFDGNDQPQNPVKTVNLIGTPIVALVIDGQERLCLAQISNTLLKQFSYNEIHNRRVALGITCVQCTPVQLELLRRAGAMAISSRRCGMISKREAERLCKSFLADNAPPNLPDNFAFTVAHKCAWGCKGSFVPSRYNSSRAKCIRCLYCSLFYSPNKFIFHSHRNPDAVYTQPDAANFNSWRRHLNLTDSNLSEDLQHAWEDVKAMFNGGSRKRMHSSTNATSLHRKPRFDSQDSNDSYSSSHDPGNLSSPSPSAASALHNAEFIRQLSAVPPPDRPLQSAAAAAIDLTSILSTSYHPL